MFIYKENLKQARFPAIGKYLCKLWNIHKIQYNTGIKTYTKFL